MSKKFFDILPPKEAENQAKPVRQFEERVEDKPKRPAKRRSSRSKKGLFLVLAFFFILIIFAFFFLSRAEVEVWVATDVLEYEETVTASSDARIPDFSNRTVPAELFEKEIVLSEEFTATGKTEKRAEGMIRVYNAFSTTDQILIANTRFVSADGKLFRSPERIVIPGGSYDERGRFVPGHTDILIRADQPGEEYNIDSTTFSIPGLAGTERYTTVYGQSFSPMSGGGEVALVTEDDLSAAKEEMEKRMLEKGEDSLKSELSLDFVLIDDALMFDIVKVGSEAEAGKETSSFVFEVKANSQALVFKKTDLESLAEEFILSRAPSEKLFLKESLEMDYQVESIDFDSEKIVLAFNFSGKIYSDINQKNLKEGIKGKSFNEAQMLLEDYLEISYFELKLWPFWVKKVPNNTDKIKVKLNID